MEKIEAKHGKPPQANKASETELSFHKKQGSLSRPQCPETGRLLREVLVFPLRFPGHAELRNSVISIISVIVAASNGNQGGLCSCSAGVQVSPLGQSVELELVRDVNTEI